MSTSPASADQQEDALADLLAFDPVPMERRRTNGWTAQRQRAFIAALATCGVVSDAARGVGMSARSAYQLRLKPGADSFDAAWARAQEDALINRKGEVLDRALNGDLVTILRGGRLVGVRRELSLGKQLRVFTALGREQASREARAMAAHDRQWERDCAANRKARDIEDRKAAADAEARCKANEQWLREAEEAREAAHCPAPKVRIL